MDEFSFILKKLEHKDGTHTWVIDYDNGGRGVASQQEVVLWNALAEANTQVAVLAETITKQIDRTDAGGKTWCRHCNCESGHCGCEYQELRHVLADIPAAA